MTSHSDGVRSTASKTALLMRCNHWTKPESEWGPNEPGEAAQFGTAVHAYGEWQIGRPEPGDIGQTLPSDIDLVRYTWVCAQARRYIDAHRTPGWRAEVAFALDLDTGKARELPHRELGRDYEARGATASEMCGTADVVWDELSTDAVFVRDWKTGKPSESDAAQLLTLAVMATRAYGRDAADVACVRLTESAATEDTAAIYTRAALDAAYDALVLAHVPRGPRPGPHCVDLYCPHRFACSATQEALASTLPPEALVAPHKLSLVVRSAEHCAWQIDVRRRVQAALNDVDKANKAWVDAHGPVLTGEGREWGPGPIEGRLSAEKLERLAQKLGASPAELEACRGEPSIQYRERKVRP
jgi:hypothetical protein